MVELPAAKVIAPEYDPAAGIAPLSVTVTVPDPPGDNGRLVLSRVGVSPAVRLPETLLTPCAAATVNVTAADPVLVTVIVLVTLFGAAASVPNEIVDGRASTVEFTAAPTSRRPAPTHWASIV